MNQNTEIIKHLSMISELGLTMVGCIGVGFAIGFYVDLKLGHSPLWTIVFLLVGIASGFWSVYKLVMKKIK